MYYDSSLEEPTTDLYCCPVCGVKKEVNVTYDSRMFYPDRIKDAICGACDIEMDKERRI